MPVLRLLSKIQTFGQDYLPLTVFHDRVNRSSMYSGTRRRGVGVGRAGGAAWLLNTHSDHKIM